MSAIVELVGDVLVDVCLHRLPESTTGRYILFGFVGLVLAATVGAVLWNWPAPEDQPAWAFAVFCCSIFYGGVFFVATSLSFRVDRRPAITFCFLTSAAALLLPLGSMIL